MRFNPHARISLARYPIWQVAAECDGFGAAIRRLKEELYDVCQEDESVTANLLPLSTSLMVSYFAAMYASSFSS